VNPTKPCFPLVPRHRNNANAGFIDDKINSDLLTPFEPDTPNAGPTLEKSFSANSQSKSWPAQGPLISAPPQKSGFLKTALWISDLFDQSSTPSNKNKAHSNHQCGHASGRQYPEYSRQLRVGTDWASSVLMRRTTQTRTPRNARSPIRPLLGRQKRLLVLTNLHTGEFHLRADSPTSSTTQLETFESIRSNGFPERIHPR